MTLFQLVGLTLEMIGTVLIAIAVYTIHGRVMREGKIDRAIVRAMRRERSLVPLGIFLTVLGFLLQMVASM